MDTAWIGSLSTTITQSLTFAERNVVGEKSPIFFMYIIDNSLNFHSSFMKLHDCQLRIIACDSPNGHVFVNK